MTAIVPDSIKKRLASANITEAAIIDETFDGISQESLNGLDNFLAELEDDEVLQQAKAICPSLEQASDFDLDHAKELWSAKDRWGDKLKPHAELLLNVYSQRVGLLDTLAKNLEGLGLTIHKIGIGTMPPATVGLVFLDYCLQPDRETALIETRVQQLTATGKIDPTGALALKSEEIAKKLAALGIKRPFLVLISDRSELDKVHDNFRVQTNYLGGTFAFLAKTAASNQEALYFKIGCWGVGHPALASIRQFFEAAVNSLDNTVTEFKQVLLALDAQDYSFIQRLSLSAEGEPLGDYMLELIGGALSHRFRSQTELAKATETLNTQHFTAHLPSSSQPSSELRRLYQDAITEPNISELAPHPLHHLETPQPAETLPRLVLGDILAKDETNLVYMVLNASCDLQFSPINPGRSADPSLPIYLLPGHLELLNVSTSDAAAKRTELFELKGKSYRILWDFKHVFTVAHSEIKKWCDDRKYSRIERLSPVYVLSMQQIWTSSVGRVGVMVTPPLTESADFQIYFANGQNLLEPFQARICGQIILGTLRQENQDVEWFLLTTEGMLSLHNALKQYLPQIDQFEAAVPDGPRKNIEVSRLRQLKSKIESTLANGDQWFGLLENEFRIARSDGKRLTLADRAKLPITFFWQAYPKGKLPKECGGSDILLFVDILRPEAPDNPSPQLATAQTTCGLEHYS
jgi:hypothetical protein